MWLFLFLFFVQASPANPSRTQAASPTQTQLPSLIVQVVDPNWMPIPSAKVTVAPLGGNSQQKPSHAETDKDGYANFSVPRDADYAIEAESHGFRRGRVSPVHLFDMSGPSSAAYVQLRLRLAPAPPVVVN